MNGYDPRQPPYPPYPPAPNSAPILGPNGQIQVGGIVIQNNTSQPVNYPQPHHLATQVAPASVEPWNASPATRLAAAGLGTAVFGSISLLAAIGVLAPGLLFFSVVPTLSFAALTGFLAWSSRKGGPSDRAVAAALETKIVQLAARRGGVLTVLDVVAQLQIPSETADAALQSLAKAGHISADVDMQTGTLTYSFPLSLPPESAVERPRLGPRT